MGRLFPTFVDGATEIVGVDISDELLLKGKQYFEKNSVDNTDIQFVNGNMCSFANNKKYDLIVFALSVLKHLANDTERMQALKTAKEHLSEDGLIVIDHTALLYADGPVDWTPASQSLVASWVAEPEILQGYQWRKTLDGATDILEWRYQDTQQKTLFEVKFTTYRYDIEALTQHLEELGLYHELMLTEWGVNGLSDKGKRFIGIAGFPGNGRSPRERLLEKVKRRGEKLWSNHEIATEEMLQVS